MSESTMHGGRRTTYYDTRAVAPREYRRSWLLPGLVALLMLALVGLALCGCSGPSEDTNVATSGTEEPSTDTGATASTAESTTTTDDGVADLPMAGPTAIDVPTEEVASAVITPEGGVIRYGPVKVEVPSGAVAQDTTVSITRVKTPLHTDPVESAPSDSVPALWISSIYDLGPAGLVFDKPVTVTLPYDPGLGPNAVDPERVAIAYWNGEEWMLAGGTADPGTRTVSIQLRAFEGIAMTTIAIAVGVGVLANKAVAWYYGPEMVKDDPVSEGKVTNWVTPDNPVVKQQAAKAVIYDPLTKQTKPLTDPGVADWVESICKSGYDPALAYKNPDGTISQSVYDSGEGSCWQKPSDYFTKGTVIRPDNLGKPLGGPLCGDCTDLANATVSVLKASGFHAKGVIGYGGGGANKNETHAWGEVLIGNRVYRIDEGGSLLAPDNTADTSMSKKHYDDYAPITDPNDPRSRSMWDDVEQQPYAADWWAPFVKYDVNGRWSGTMIWKAINLTDDVKQGANDQGCDARFFDELLNTPLPLTMDVKVDVAGKGTATLTVDVSSLKKYNNNISSSPEVYDCTLVGDTLTIKVRDAGNMVGKVSQQGKELAMVGGLSVTQDGSTMTIEFKVTKQPS